MISSNDSGTADQSKPDNNTALKDDIANAMYSTDYQHLCEEPDYFDKGAVDAVLALFQEHSTARVVEARLDEAVKARQVAYNHTMDDCKDVISVLSERINELESSLTKEAEK